MKKPLRQLLAVTLCLAMLAGFCLLTPVQVEAAEFYKDYTTIKVVENTLGCYSMQGCDSDDTYIYCTKIDSENEDKAVILRVNRDGSTNEELMTNGDTGTQLFTQLAHANDLDVSTINGVKTLWVATGGAGTGDYSLVRFAMNGKTLTQVGHYNVKYNGTSTYLAGVQVMSVEGDQIKLICKRNKNIFTCTIGVNQTSGDVALTSLCNLDVTNTIVNGAAMDISTWVQQGFEYYDGKIYVPMTGPTGLTDQSVIIAYDVVGASGTIRNDPSWSIHVTSGTYSDLFEIESCTICPSDGKMYISTNRRKTSSDANHDGVHVIQKYVYNPALGDSAQTGNYRWVTKDNQLISVTDGGASYNHAQVITGTVSGSKIVDGRYSLDQAVVLKAADPWIIQWKASNATSNTLLLSNSRKSSYTDNAFLYTRKDGLISFGTYNGTQYNNYGINITNHGLNTTAEHTYRLENRINSDGSNMVYLKVDGKELGAMNNYFVGGTAQNTTNAWISGKDFSFSYLGTDSHMLNGTISEICIWGQGAPGAVDEANTYRWETKSNALTAISGVGLTANTATQLYGSCASNVYKDYQAELAQDVVLLHNRPWSVEFKTSTGINGAMLLASAQYSKTQGAPLLQFGDALVFGAYDGAAFQKCGLTLSNYGIDYTAAHTYRLTNRIAADGSNMVYLYVDDQEIAPMNNYYIGGTAQGTTSDWLNGRDLSFSHLGTYQNDITGALEHLQIWENGIPAQIGGTSYRWTPATNTLTSSTNAPYKSNSVTSLGGANTATSFNNSWFRLEKPVVLLHNRPWTIQWESEGTWKGSANGAMLFSASRLKNEINAPYLYRRGNSEFIAFGTRADGNHHNYGVSLSAHGIDGTAKHTYTLTNKVNTDGSNMIYLSVDGVELGAMNNYFLGGAAQNTTNNWVSGKDFVFNYVGTPDFPLGNCSLTYLQVDGSCEHSYSPWTETQAATCVSDGSRQCSCSLCGDVQTEVIPATGHNYKTTVVAPTCTTGGYTTYTCTCGDTYTGNQTNATGHSFAEGICGVCGAVDPNYSPAVVIPTLTLKAPTLEFKDMITVNAMFTAENIDDVVEMGMITYTEKVDEWSVETAKHIIPGTTYDVNTGRYIACSQGIHAKYLGDTVYLACYAKLTDGSYVYTKLASYSPVQYATSKLNGTDVALKQLVVAMLNYGAAAQTHFEHNVENLANASLTAEQLALPESYRSDMVSTVASPSAAKQGAFANNSGFARRYPSISFEGAFCINYFFTPNYAPVDGITLYYWNAADYEAVDVLSIENASGSFKLEGEGIAEYRGDITGIAAKDLSEAVYVAAVYSDGTTEWTSGVLGYSIGAYCASQSTKGGTIAELAKATAVYGYQAKVYFG